MTESDLMDLISQESYGIRKVRYCNHTDAYGNTDVDQVTIAVLVEEYEKGAHVFSQVKKKIKDRLLSGWNLPACRQNAQSDPASLYG